MNSINIPTDMNETGEVPVVTEGPVSPEFDQAMKAAVAEIQSDAQNPAMQVAKSTAELGFFAELGNVVKAHGKRELGIQWKNVKATGMAAISLVPLLGEGVAAAKAISSAEQAASVAQKAGVAINKARTGEGMLSAVGNATTAFETAEKAKKAAKVLLKGKKLATYNKAIARGASEVEALKYARQGMITMKTGEKILHSGKEIVKDSVFHNAVRFIDPTPDVPGLVTMGTVIAEMFGVHGAMVIPAVWQLGVNGYESMKNRVDLVKDVGGVYKRQAEKLLGRLKQPEVSRAAKVFVPAAA